MFAHIYARMKDKDCSGGDGKSGTCVSQQVIQTEQTQLLKAATSFSFSHLSFDLKLWRGSAAALLELKCAASCPCFVGARFLHVWKRTKTRRRQGGGANGTRRCDITEQNSSEPNVIQVTSNVLHVSVSTSTTWNERCFNSGFLLFDCFSLRLQK